MLRLKNNRVRAVLDAHYKFRKKSNQSLTKFICFRVRKFKKILVFILKINSNDWIMRYFRSYILVPILLREYTAQALGY